MRPIYLLTIFLVVSVTSRGPPPDQNGPPPNGPATDAPNDTDDDTDDDSSEDGSYATTVKALIDAGTCAQVEENDNCGGDATGYYETFEYDGQRVIIISGAPNHAAETDLFLSDGGFNPNVRCERWQFATVPLSPEKSDSTDWTDYTTYPYYGMGAYGYATSGGVFFDTRSNPNGETAWDNEIDTLDTCMGHSNDALQYHYHGVPYCIPEDTWLADDATVCQFVGYMMDGYPIYGRCQHTNGDELESCWTANTDDTNELADYDYGSTASGNTCYLDEANGYEFTEGQTSDGYTGYGYVTTTEFSGVPIGFMGSEFGTICGFTP